MNPCVFWVSQYLRVLILSCSIVIVISKTTKLSVSAPQWINHHKGDRRPKAHSYMPSRKFSTKWKSLNSYILMTYDPVPWCLSHSVLWSSWINHQWMMNLKSSIISPLIAMSELWFSRISGQRWRTEAFSRWGILRPALRKKGIHKLIASWSSFIAHRTTDNACVCQSCDSRTVLSLRSSLSWTTQLQELHP